MQVTDNGLLDFDTAYGVNRFSLRLMGIWPADQVESSKSFLTVLRVPVMILVTFFFVFLPQMYALMLVIKHLPLVLENIITSCPAFTSCIKLYFIWRTEQVLKPVIDSASKDYLRRRSKLEDSIMRREAFVGRLVTVMDYSIMTICYLGFILMPLAGVHIRTINNLTDYGSTPLVVQSYFPYDYSRSPALELTYLLQIAGSFCIGMAVSIPDDYFCALVLHTSAQFEILGQQIENMSIYRTRRLNSHILGRFIERHVHLNKMVHAVEQSFEIVIGAQIFCMSIMVCCLGFQILNILDNTSDKPTFVQIGTLGGTLVTMLLHTFADCFASEKLALRSSEIFNKIYSSEWYALTWDQRRCLIPMMLIAKTPRHIKAGKILFLSLTTYCSIIKTTAGYISMLIAING